MCTRQCKANCDRPGQGPCADGAGEYNENPDDNGADITDPELKAAFDNGRARWNAPAAIYERMREASDALMDRASPMTKAQARVAIKRQIRWASMVAAPHACSVNAVRETARFRLLAADRLACDANSHWRVPPETG